jgi:hypothetical protein
VSLALPLNDGFVLFDGDAGPVSVTFGEAVLTTKLTGLLTPAGFPTELCWIATAVYSPLNRAVPAFPETQLPPVPEADASETTAPKDEDPSWIWTVTAVVSLAVPLNDGVALFEGVGGALSVTVGEAVMIVNVTGPDVLVPPSSSACSATAVYVPSSRAGLVLTLHELLRSGDSVVSVRSRVPPVLSPL